jgi:hypothetical protein
LSPFDSFQLFLAYLQFCFTFILVCFRIVLLIEVPTGLLSFPTEPFFSNVHIGPSALEDVIQTTYFTYLALNLNLVHFEKSFDS